MSNASAIQLFLSFATQHGGPASVTENAARFISTRFNG